MGCGQSNMPAMTEAEIKEEYPFGYVDCCGKRSAPPTHQLLPFPALTVR